MKPHFPKSPLLALLLMLTGSASGAELHVPADHPTIQAAVDAASSGDTIRIAAGVYAEQTRINRKNLNLIGEPGTILRAFPNMEDATPENNSRCVLFILLSSNVIVRNLAFEGDQLADQQGDANNVIGVYHLDSGGAVENCRFTGFRERVPGPGRGRAIRCRNDLPGAPLYSFRAVGNTIEDSYLGLEVIGAPDKLSLNVTLEDNHIQGVGPNTNSSSLMRGMDLGDGITGSVAGNTISGFSYSGEGAEFPWGWGIIAIGEGFPGNRALDPIRFENNVFENNNLHLVLSKGDQCQVLNNRFRGSGPGLSRAGLWFTGQDVEVRGNTFRDMPVGVIAGGENPILGTDLGFAVDAVLADNRFTGVDTPINHEPGSSATETGTLLPPWPEPALAIGQALRLSWPSYHDNYHLETGPTLEGPWTAAEVEPNDDRMGSLESFVPLLESQGFFRLQKDDESGDQ